jgi:putative ABC transport system ATP-binding protein
MVSTAHRAAPLLDVADLTVRAGGAPLLVGIALRLEPGELVAVTGPSGSGKTSLLRTLAGLVGDGGGVRLRGQEPQAIGWPTFRRRMILVDQQPVLVPGTVGENLARPFAYRHAGLAFDADAARTLLARLGLARVALTADAQTLSVGQQQRVALARALLLASDVLLLDEPTSALDAENARRVEETIRREAVRNGLAALVVTHSVEQARRWCDRRIDLRPFTAANPHAGSAVEA